MIVPVGLYQERVWRSITRSGANRIYMLLDSKPEYIAEDMVYRELEGRIKQMGLPDINVIKKQADLTSFEDIYRVYTEIIVKERTLDSTVKLVLDVTSCPREVTLVVPSLATTYGTEVTFVPGKEKVTKPAVDDQYRHQKDDSGGDYKEFTPGQTELSVDEIAIMSKYYQQAISGRRYNSVNDVIKEIGEARGKRILPDAEKKRYLRVVRELESRRLLTSSSVGRTKTIDLTEIGRGLIRGITEADAELKREGSKQIISGMRNR